MLCNMANDIINNSVFDGFILICICAAGLLVGMQTYPSYDNNSTVAFIDNFILYSFVLECLLKILSNGMSPWLFFIGNEWEWNVFDFVIVFFALPFLPFAQGNLKILRLLRLTRLVKVFRKIPQLRMILEGFIGGLQSVAYLAFLMALVFYVYAIMGIFIFQKNDPWHFRSIEVSMINLMRVAAFDVRICVSFNETAVR